MRRLVLAGVFSGVIAAAACGGDKPPAADEASTATPAVTPMPQDAMMPDSMKERMADTASKSGAPSPTGQKAERPLRDSAYGPSFKIDSAGKVTPIKRP